MLPPLRVIRALHYTLHTAHCTLHTAHCTHYSALPCPALPCPTRVHCSDQTHCQARAHHQTLTHSAAADARCALTVRSETGLDGIDFYADITLLDPSTGLLQYAMDAKLSVGVWVWSSVLPGCDSPRSWQWFHDLNLSGYPLDFFTSDLPHPGIWEWEAGRGRA
jgi:hypothetical protein